MSNERQEYDLTANIQEVLSLIHTKGGGNEETNPETDEEERETIHVYPVEGGGILFTRTPIEPIDDDLDTTPITPPQPKAPAGSGIVFFGVFVTLLCLFCIAAQFYQIVNPFSVTVTLVAKSQRVALQGTLQLGRALNPITVSQSQSIPTTGHGHQNARAATGFITFYSGQFNQVTIPAGTVLTSSSGVQVVTDQDAVIPAANLNPPEFGQVTVSAHVTNPGSQGNIAAYDINQTCCATSVLVKNTAPFQGGQDERNFQTVAKSDIDQAAAPMKATLAQSINGALQGQVKQGEQLQTLPCSPTVTSDHQVGEEATQVKVTTSATCSGIAYNGQELTSKVTQLLTTQAATKLGSAYSLLGNVQVTVTGATRAKQVMLSFSSVSTWVYGISSQQQHHIGVIIAGKNTQQALRLLNRLPGIENASLQFSGFGDASRIPKTLSTIHLMIFYGL